MGDNLLKLLGNGRGGFERRRVLRMLNHCGFEDEVRIIVMAGGCVTAHSSEPSLHTS